MAKEFPRALECRLRSLARTFRVISLTGPRQAGKTTLARRAFPRFAYVTLEDLDQREFATQDPRGFLDRFAKRPGVILDEVQRTPGLFSYLQGIVDGPGTTRYILTGSEQFQLSERISQTLAGRAAVLRMLGLSLGEVAGRKALTPAGLFRVAPLIRAPGTIDEWLFRGSFPRLHAENVPVRAWLNGYVRTYVERDVREILGVADAGAFVRFLALVAGRTGQLLNASALGADAGVSHATVQRWISVLETSGLVLLLPPHHENHRKRIIKAPKIYLTDTGLACFLLGIRSPADLRSHPLRGHLFETLVVMEIVKVFSNQGETPPLFFFRDRTGLEVDLLVDLGKRLLAIEIKSSATVREDALSGLKRYLKTAPLARGALVSGSSESYLRSGMIVRPWFACS